MGKYIILAALVLGGFVVYKIVAGFSAPRAVHSSASRSSGVDVGAKPGVTDTPAPSPAPASARVDSGLVRMLKESRFVSQIGDLVQLQGLGSYRAGDVLRGELVIVSWDFYAQHLVVSDHEGETDIYFSSSLEEYKKAPPVVTGGAVGLISSMVGSTQTD